MVYHVFSVNYDITSENWVSSISDDDINKHLVSVCTEYYEIMERKVPVKLARLTDTNKLIKHTLELSRDMTDFCTRNCGCDNKGNIILGIVKGGEVSPALH